MALSLRFPGSGGFGAGSGFTVSFTPDPPPSGTVSLVYDGITSHFHRGKPPRVFSIFAGTLPPGLSIDSSSGAISGTPTLAGTYAGIVIRCTAANGNTANTSPFTIVIAP